MAGVEEVISLLDESNRNSIDALTRDLARIRAGKASPNLLEGLKVSFYGQMSPINQVGNISTPDARTLVIAPWDQSVLPEVEKAINASDLGLNPQNDGKIIRLNIPALTEERRKELVKQVNKTGEEGRVSIRQNRKLANDGLKGLEKAKQLSEDEVKRKMEEVQKKVDSAIQKVDEMVKKKTDDIMTI